MATDDIILLDEQRITVGRLLELLTQAVSSDPRIAEYRVIAEGCDCVGDAFGICIRHDPQPGDVMIARKSSQR